MEKVRQQGRDQSRHLLCPSCKARTKLYALKDGRKKCSVCKTKFFPSKKHDDVKIRQYADVLLCFTLGLPAKQASDITKYRYRLVSALYDRFRILLALQNLTPGKMQLLTTVESCDYGVHDSMFCRRCRGRFDCKGRKSGDSPIFGVKILTSNRVFIDPLAEEEASLRFDMTSDDEGTKAREHFSGYAGFICRGKLHRFTDNERTKDGAEQLWSWMSERLRKYHGIWKGNAGFYLKELEWKYNNRLLTAETQAMKLAELMPPDFLRSWVDTEKITLDLGLPAVASPR